ncbi:DUF2142 domain-containing protein [Streptococcus halotolerans]|uniref:DUF2142 domain-containing protein n=1 Tax=Streptococcus halotolerans TaxID=1814128 RepID=UPI0007884F4B|nr:DUF2142 domain-containing protein [Streptococcus halotolerans]
MKKIFNIFKDKKLHKVYITLAITLGTIFSLFMPFFNEPDGQYHLAVSGMVTDSIIDASQYNEYKVDSGMFRQSEFYKNGTRLETYYFNRGSFVEKDKVPRNIRLSYFDFTFWGHLVPGIGLFLGKHIYPSMGVMITTARFLSTIVNSTIIYFVIKKVKKGKLLFCLVFLSPVVINSFASLSYDSTGFVAVGLFLMLVINTVVDGCINSNKRVQFLLSTLLILFGAKWNYWLFILFWPVLEFTYTDYFKNIRLKVYDKANVNSWSKKNKILALVLGFLLTSLVLIILTRNHGGIFRVLQRYLMTFGYNYSGSELLSNDISSWLVAPYPSQNYMPVWITAVWYLFFFLVIFMEQKFVKRKVIGLLSFLFFIVGVLGVYYTMLSYNDARTSYIEGVQGRYFTPTLLLLQITASSMKPRLNRYGRQIVPVLLFVLIIVTNLLLIFDTTVGLIMR